MSNKSKVFRPYIVVFARAACPDDHVGFELGARNAKKAERAAQHIIKKDKELPKLGLLVHVATLRVVGDYDTDCGGEGLCVGDTDDLTEVSFEDVTRMCGVYIIDNDSLRRVSSEDMLAPIDMAVTKETKTDTKKAVNKEYKYTPPTPDRDNPFPDDVMEQLTLERERFQYMFNERELWESKKAGGNK